MDPWAWAILLLVAGMGLAVLEILIPSGGVFGFLTICSVIGAVVLGFRSGAGVGMAVLATALVGLPVVVVFALKWLPETPMGRRMLLKVPTSEDVLPDSAEQRRKDLLGKIGRAKSPMLPAGVILMDGRTIDAVSEGMAIEPGQTVEVIEVRGNRVVVRPVDAEPPARRDDPLSQPVDDPFAEGPP